MVKTDKGKQLKYRGKKERAKEKMRRTSAAITHIRGMSHVGIGKWACGEEQRCHKTQDTMYRFGLGC